MPRKGYYPLSQSPLYRLRSRSKLAALLGVSNRELADLSAGDSLYREFDIEKKGGGTRHVENPHPRLKAIQTKLARMLARIEPPDYLFCPVKGRCYVKNAAQHAENRVVHCLDVRKYFPSTKARRVFWFFRNVLKCDHDIAGLLTALSTYQQHLPTGSPLSPILSFFAHYDVWEEVGTFCRERGYALTIYIDDCTISGVKVPRSDIWQIKRIIHRGGLRYHKEKSFVDRPAEITGVIVREGRVTPPHRQFRKLKQAGDALIGAKAEDSEALRSRVLGLAGQIAQIRTVATT